MLRNVLRNTGGWGQPFLCHSYSQSAQRTELYGYMSSGEDHEKRDKDNEGVVYIGKVDLPAPLKDSLKLFYENHQRKRIIADGLKLSRHIKNRGRPTHATWMRYREEADAATRASGRKKKYRNLVKNFILDEAIAEGLVSEERQVDRLDEVKTEDIVEAIAEGLVSEEKQVDQSDKVKTEDIVEAEVSENKEDDVSTDPTPTRKKISKIKRPEMASYSMIRYGSRETAAYAASQLPSVYGSTYKALYEIKKREPSYQPSTLLDFGSGTGMSVWAAHAIWKDNIKEYQCVDASEHMNQAAEYLLRGSSDIRAPLKIPNVYFKRFLPLSNQIKYDIVIAAYTLTEMPFSKQRLQAIQNLWQKTNDFLVIIEPGNNEGFETALQARRYILENEKDDDEGDYISFEGMFDNQKDVDSGKDGHIFAPCTHELVCARTDVNTRHHPCNFSQKVQLSFAHQTTNLKRLSYYNEQFSYIIFRKGKQDNKDDKAWARILEPLKLRRKHVVCELCCKNGNIERHVITKRKDPHIYKATRHILQWGDMMPLDEVKRPINVRSPPECLKAK